MPSDKFDLQGEFALLHRNYPSFVARPVIGITANFADDKATLAEAYYRSVLEAGGVPLLIPPYADRDALLSTLPILSKIITILITATL